jgi:hypothetical protein
LYYICLVQKWLSIVLILLTMAGNFIPCCTEDDCSDEVATQQDDHQQEKEKGSCSPFFACGTCAPAVEISLPVALNTPQAIRENQYHSCYFLQLSNYHAALFQPPRAG